MFCPDCGKAVSGTARFCENCGAQLKPRTVLENQPASPAVATCRFCGLPLTKGDMICRYCFRDNSLSTSDKTLKYTLAAGGLIVIVAGLLALAVTTSMAIEDIDTYSQNPVDFSIYWLLDLTAILAIVFGFQPLRCRHYGWSVVGGICSLIGGAFFIGIFGLVLILVGRRGFKD